MEKRLGDADAAQRKETAAVEERGRAALGEAVRSLEARHVRSEETIQRHWCARPAPHPSVADASQHLPHSLIFGR